MSPRPKRSRTVEVHPIIRGMKPLGVPFQLNDRIVLLYEEFESIRLSDYESLPQEAAAKRMNVSRPTFTRIYDEARRKMAKALVEGLPVFIDGGNVTFNKEWYRCNSCNVVVSTVKGEITACSSCGSEDIEHINSKIEKWRDNKSELNIDILGMEKYCLCMDCYLRKGGDDDSRCSVNTCPKVKQ